jgi:hypothetical protein
MRVGVADVLGGVRDGFAEEDLAGLRPRSRVEPSGSVNRIFIGART